LYFITFRLFKVEIYMFSILFASVIASFISFSLREIYGYATLDIIVQLLLTFLFIWQLFRVHVFYSALMSVTGFITLLVIQTGLFFVVNTFGFMQDTPTPNALSTHLLQLLSASIAFLISYFIRKKKLGFTFVPHSNHGSIQLTASNRHVLLIYISSLFPICLMYFLLDTRKNNLFFIIPISLGFILLALLYWANRRELSDD
jgi:hypothetical protein